MAKPKPLTVQIPITEPSKHSTVALGKSKLYLIEKYGLYRYQVFSVDLITGEKTKHGEENVYAVAASNLVDIMFYDINPDQSSR